MFRELRYVLFALILVLSLGVRRDGLAQQPLEPNWSQRAEKALAEGRNEEAIKIVDQFIASVPNNPSGYIIRGMVFFRLGRIQESLTDFDKSIELEPNSKPECWQRGISLYYLKRYDEGREQFEVHRTVNASDVENPFWHFMCVSKLEGIEAARNKLLPCGRDGRSPLMEVLEMLRGKMEPEQVIEAADAARGGPEGKSLARFYGHLYVGLYYDCLGKLDLAKMHLEKCVAEKTGGYMRNVAQIHLAHLAK
jgi:lipoprotein NlpI